MSIADELENREIEICPVCNENPKRVQFRTCSRECSIKRDRILKVSYNREYHKRPEVRLKQKIYGKEYCKRQYVKDKVKVYQQRPEVKERIRKWSLVYRSRPEVIARYKIYYQRPDVKERHRISGIKSNI